MSERFLYEVKPLRPIRKMGQKEMRRPFVALLTIDEVKEYMQYGPVYRKYADINKGMVKVTGENLSKLHRDPEDEVKVSKVAVADLIPNDNKVEIAEPKKSIVEESIEATPVVDEPSTENNEIIAESEPAVNDNLEKTNDGEDIVEVEEEVANETTVDATVVEATTEPEQSEEVEAETIEENTETADEATVTEEATESEEQTEAEDVDVVEDSVDDESANNQNKQNNYNKNKKHKNNNNVQFKQQ